MDSLEDQAALRRSKRQRPAKRSYSPPAVEPLSTRKRKKTSSLPAGQSGSADRRLPLVLPSQDAVGSEGKAFSCDMCKSPYIIHPARKKRGRKNQPVFPRHKTDPITGKLLTLCNACGLSLKRPGVQPYSARKDVSLPEDKQKYLEQAKAFATGLAQTFHDSDAERLYCPRYKAKPCRCVQTYLMNSGKASNYKKRVCHLLKLIKMAKKLSTMKCYNADEKERSEGKKRSKCIGLGNGQKKSPQFEKFVMARRKYLREEVGLCEGAVQKLLSYSNNFLFKKLKTEEARHRVKRVKGKAALGMLVSISDLVKEACCKENCVLMALTHESLLDEWRCRSRQSQREARRVLAEMLTPSGLKSNCHRFIQLVTGLGQGLICNVSHYMKLNKGKREPPTHGLHTFWQNKSGAHQEKNTTSTPPGPAKGTCVPSMAPSAIPEEFIVESITEEALLSDDLGPYGLMKGDRHVKTGLEQDVEVISACMIEVDSSTEVYQVPIIIHQGESIPEDTVTIENTDLDQVSADLYSHDATGNHSTQSLVCLRGHDHLLSSGSSSPIKNLQHIDYCSSGRQSIMLQQYPFKTPIAAAAAAASQPQSLQPIQQNIPQLQSNTESHGVLYSDQLLPASLPTRFTTRRLQPQRLQPLANSEFASSTVSLDSCTTLGDSANLLSSSNKPQSMLAISEGKDVLESALVSHQMSTNSLKPLVRKGGMMPPGAQEMFSDHVASQAEVLHSFSVAQSSWVKKGCVEDSLCYTTLDDQDARLLMQGQGKEIHQITLPNSMLNTTCGGAHDYVLCVSNPVVADSLSKSEGMEFLQSCSVEHVHESMGQESNVADSFESSDSMKSAPVSKNAAAADIQSVVSVMSPDMQPESRHTNMPVALPELTHINTASLLKVDSLLNPPHLVDQFE